MPRAFTLIGCRAALVLTCALCACNRGTDPNGPQLAPGLSVTWSVEAFEGSDRIHSIPVSDGTRLFAASGSATIPITAINENQGGPFWQTHLGGTDIPPTLIVRRSLVIADAGASVTAWGTSAGGQAWTVSPVGAHVHVWPAADSLWYYSARDYRPFALSQDDGSQAWTVDLRNGDYTTGATQGLSYSGDTLYVVLQQTTGGTVAWYYALNRTTGALLWKLRDTATAASGAPRGPPVIAGNFFVVADSAGSIVAINRFNPAVAWRTATVANGGVAAPPTVIGSVVYVGTASPAHLMALNLSDGSVKWSVAPDSGTMTGFAVCNNEVIAGTAGIASVDAATGAVRGLAFPSATRPSSNQPQTGIWTDGIHAFFISQTESVLLHCD